MQRCGVPMYRIQYGIKCVQVDDEDWKVKWNRVLITSVDNLVLLTLRVELGLEPCYK